LAARRPLNDHALRETGTRAGLFWHPGCRSPVIRPYTTRQPPAPGSRGVASRLGEDYIQPSSLPACRLSAPCPFPHRPRPRGGDPPRRRLRLPPQESHERTRRSGDKTNPAAPGAFRKYPREPDGPLAPDAHAPRSHARSRTRKIPNEPENSWKNNGLPFSPPSGEANRGPSPPENAGRTREAPARRRPGPRPPAPARARRAPTPPSPVPWPGEGEMRPPPPPRVREAALRPPPPPQVGEGGVGAIRRAGRARKRPSEPDEPRKINDLSPSRWGRGGGPAASPAPFTAAAG
jgi:hypothetical protein